jgi:hypothetical protein
LIATDAAQANQKKARGFAPGFFLELAELIS